MKAKDVPISKRLYPQYTRPVVQALAVVRVGRALRAAKTKVEGLTILMVLLGC